MTQLNRVLAGVELSLEEQLKLSVELMMGNFIQAHVTLNCGSTDSQDDVEAAMSAWFKASSDVKIAQLQAFADEDEDADEQDGLDDEELDDESEAA